MACDVEKTTSGVILRNPVAALIVDCFLVMPTSFLQEAGYRPRSVCFSVAESGDEERMEYDIYSARRYGNAQWRSIGIANSCSNDSQCVLLIAGCSILHVSASALRTSLTP